LKPEQPANIYLEKDWQLIRILYILIGASWTAYLFVVATAIYYSDAVLFTATLVGCALLIIPFVLLRRRRLRASSLVVVLIILGTLTIIATVGQGIRDLAIIAFPIILIFAGLTLNRALFRLCVGLTLAAVCWLAIGEALGLFVTKPFVGEMTNWFYLLGVTIILLVAALAVELLATNMRRNLERAQTEIAQRKLVEEQLRHTSTHDNLTGINNRSFFESELERLELSHEFPVSIVVADVDNLKIANDTLGHAAGDEILRHVAQVLRSMFRRSDVVARIGGDEFCVLLPSADAETAMQIVSRIQERLNQYNSEYPDMPVQLALGVATAEKNDLAEAFKAADRRMYADKSEHKSSSSHSPHA